MTQAPAPLRDRFGRWKTGPSPNPQGRLPRQTESEYLDVTMRTVSTEKWAEVIAIALEDALNKDLSAHVRARAREWLGKFVIGDTTQLLYKEERSFEIVVRFEGDERKALPEAIDDVIDGEIIEG